MSEYRKAKPEEGKPVLNLQIMFSVKRTVRMISKR